MHKWIKAVHVVAGEIGGTVEYGYRGHDAEFDCVGIVCEDARACIKSAAKFELLDACVDPLDSLQIVYWPWLSARPVDNT